MAFVLSGLCSSRGATRERLSARAWSGLTGAYTISGQYTLLRRLNT